MTIRLITLLFVFLTLSGCQQEPEKPFQRRILSFGTYVDVTLYGIEQSKADKAIKHIEKQLNIMHEQWHAWRKSSLTQLNDQLVSGLTFEADEAVLPLVLESQELYNKTNGLFNPAIGKLIELWGFYRDNPQDNKTIPPAEEIKKLLDSGPSMADIQITGSSVKGSNTDLQLDFGGYAKGYGVDQLVEQLKAQGINNALINAGGDLRAIGRPGNRAWKIAIQHPEKNQPVGWLELNDDESVFSSGNYRRNFSKSGKNYHHIIDPRTGYPSENAAAVTVIHSSGATADATATALMVAKTEEWLPVAKSVGLTHLLIIDKDGQMYSDKSFAQRLHLTDPDMNIHILGILGQKQ